MSKKMAEGIDALVLDVKFGRGAFMKTLPEARALAEAMCAIGAAMAKPTRALLTRMDQPLGRAVGNAVEVAESIACLRGETEGLEDLLELTYALGTEMLLLAGVETEADAARARLAGVVASGAAWEKLREIVAAQGGDARVCDDPVAVLPAARFTGEVRAARAGWVGGVDAMAVAWAALRLGAGRTRAEAAVDHAVGFTRLVKVGARLAAGDLLGVVHANDGAELAEALGALAGAVEIADESPPAVALIVGRVGG
jgi:thymidine phosphorylase